MTQSFRDDLWVRPANKHQSCRRVTHIVEANTGQTSVREDAVERPIQPGGIDGLTNAFANTSAIPAQTRFVDSRALCA